MSFINIPRPEKKSPKVFDSDKPLSEIDKGTLNELLSIFNREFISFYTNHDFNASFRGEHWNKLSLFCDTWDDVTHEFVDIELEAYKKRLYEQSCKIGNVIATYTTPTQEGFYSVYPTNRIYNEEEKKRYKSEAQEINKECAPFVAVCEEFVRYARKRLAES